MSRRLVVEADGGSRGNPGPAGYGALVKDAATGELLVERAEYLGRVTNNVAEYRGLIAGLRAAAQIDPDAEIEVRMDSKLVVEQMSGRWKVKHPDMRPLASEAASLAGDRVRYTWIPREINTHADRLANEAMDAGARGEVWSTPAGSAGRAGSAGSTAGAEPLAAPRPDAEAGSAAAPNKLVGWDPDLATPTRFLLVRHGQTPLTAGKRFSGLGEDPSLTDLGEEQARRVAGRLAALGGIDAVVCSPYRRTVQTASAIAVAVGLNPREVPELRECDFGAWEGLTFAEVQAGWPDELRDWLAATAVAPPGGESFDEVGRRVDSARARLMARYAGRTVVVVSHVTPIKHLVRSALGAPASALHRLRMMPASLSAVSWWADGGAELALFNDTSHLG